MAKTDFKTADEYNSTFPDEIKQKLETVRSIIRKTAPGAEEVISYQIPAYKYMGFLVYYSGYKEHISLSYPFSEAFLKEFATELKKYKVSKSAIQFPHKEELPEELIGRMVKFRMRENEEKELSKPKKEKGKK